MKPITALKSIAEFFAAPFTRKSEFERIQLDYFKACNRLNRYRQKTGLNPGVRVLCKFRDDPPKKGVIAPYGRDWYDVTTECVPILLDNGRRQPWALGDLTILSE